MGNEDEGKLSIITRKFLQNRPLNGYWQECLAWIELNSLSVDSQDVFLKATAGHELSLKYPGSLSYRNMFLTRFSRQVDAACEPYSDVLCELQMMAGAPDDDFHHATYSFGGGVWATFRQSARMSDIEAVVWPPGLVLSELLVTMGGKYGTVLELGTGTGVCSIVAAKAGAHKVYATDLPSALPLIATNAALNDAPAVIPATLDWCADAEVQAGQLDAMAPPDVVIAADCVYAPDLVDPLADLLLLIKTRHPTCDIVIASSRRREDTQEFFRRELGRRGFIGSRVGQAQAMVYLEGHERESVVIDRFTLALPGDKSLG